MGRVVADFVPHLPGRIEDVAIDVVDDDEVATLNWGVCEQPWEEGDQLMIRISESGAALTGATNDAECAATVAAP